MGSPLRPYARLAEHAVPRSYRVSGAPLGKIHIIF